MPLTEAADNVAGSGAANPVFTIGGAAFLDSWFDVYRQEARRRSSLTVAAGDSVGATPPISSFFGDTPTIEIMNMMDFDADGLGNHNFDKGQAYLRNTLDPARGLPVPVGERPRQQGSDAERNGTRRVTFRFGDVRLGLVGFTNEDAPTLVSPGAFDPFTVVPRQPQGPGGGQQAAQARGRGRGHGPRRRHGRDA